MENVQTVSPVAPVPAKTTLKTRLAQAVAVGSSVAICATANAAIDTAGVTSAITDGATAAGVVGAAALVFFVGVRVFKIIRGAV
jgi:hypothetical protein